MDFINEEGVIFDTNILINNPNVLLEMDNIRIPYVILKELDKLKTRQDIGHRARHVSRLILENNIVCRKLFRDSSEDNCIDDLLLSILRTHPNYKLYTEDILLYLKGKAELSNVVYYNQDSSNLYEGVSNTLIKQKVVDELYSEGYTVADVNDLYENQYVFDKGKGVIAKRQGDILKYVDWNKSVSGFKGLKLTPRQIMAVDLIMDTNITVASITGRAGTGKTSLTVNGALDLIKQGVYNKLIISRPRIQRGNKEDKIGELPGDIEDKMKPYIAPFFDNIYSQTLIDVEIIPLSMIQGRDLKKSIWLITEFQDVLPTEVDNIVERVGQNSKLIVEGDINQCSRNILSKRYNGLSFLINSLKEQELTGSVKLDEVKRSETAKLGKLLRDKARIL